LGAVLASQGDYVGSEASYGQALEMFQHLYPEGKYPQGHPDLARALNNMGFVLHQRGEYARAEGFCRQSVAMHRQLYPRGHSALALSLNSMGFLLSAQGDSAGAEKFCRQALEMYQDLAFSYAEVVAESQAVNYLATQPLT